MTARAADGTIEAVEAPDAIGVQWHPEWQLEDPAGQPLFDWLVEQARLRVAA